MSPVTETVKSACGVSASVQSSANDGKASTDTSAAVDNGKVGPAAKRARRTTLAGRRQRDNDDDSGKLEAATSVEAEEKVGKQTTEENIGSAQSCEIPVYVIVFVCGFMSKEKKKITELRELLE